MTTYLLLLLLIANDAPAKQVEVSRHDTRQACVRAADNERAKPWPDKATGRVFWCREVARDAKGGK